MRNRIIATIVAVCLATSALSPLRVEASPAANYIIAGHAEALRVQEEYEKEIKRLNEEHEKELEQVKKDADARVDEAQAALGKSQQDLRKQLADAEAKYSALEEEYRRVCTELEAARRGTSTSSCNPDTPASPTDSADTPQADVKQPKDVDQATAQGSDCSASAYLASRYSSEAITGVDADTEFIACFNLDPETVEACRQGKFDVTITYPESIDEGKDGVIDLSIKMADGSYYFASVNVHAEADLRLIHGSEFSSSVTAGPTFSAGLLRVEFYSSNSEAFKHRAFSGSITGSVSYNYTYKYQKN